MATRNFAPQRAILFCVLLGGTVIEAAMAASPINYAMTFYGVWSSTTSYHPGYVVIYNGASYVCLVTNSNVTPTGNSTSATDWAILDAPGTLVDASRNTAEGTNALAQNTTADQDTAYG